APLRREHSTATARRPSIARSETEWRLPSSHDTADATWRSGLDTKDAIPSRTVVGAKGESRQYPFGLAGAGEPPSPPPPVVLAATSGTSPTRRFGGAVSSRCVVRLATKGALGRMR